MSFRIRGISDAKGTIAKLMRESEDELGGAIREEGEEIMTDAKAHYVPVDFGVLKNSGFVDGPVKVAPEHLRVTLAFGGAAEAYALVQHERTDFNHRVGGPKYLERPMRAAERGMAQRLKRRVRLRGR